MPRSYNEDLRFQGIWMKDLLGYSIHLVAATLYMSPKIRAATGNMLAENGQSTRLFPSDEN